MNIAPGAIFERNVFPSAIRLRWPLVCDLERLFISVSPRFCARVKEDTAVLRPMNNKSTVCECNRQISR